MDRLSRGMEENTLAILDSSSDKESQHFNDDRVAFIEAVRASSVVENGTRPTRKMYEAIFQILKDGKSLESITASYQLLSELDKTWSPFVFGLDVCNNKDTVYRESSGQHDLYSFNLIIQKLAEIVNMADFHKLDIKFMGNMLLCTYLVNVFEGDFFPRLRAYNETQNWTILRDSLLSTLLGSRRICYKGLIKNCLSILCYAHGGLCHNLIYSEASSVKSLEVHKNSLEIALIEFENLTSNAVQRILVMILEFDVSKKMEDMAGHTSRADGVRILLMEIILDEFTYNKDMLSQFLKVFSEPKWKLEIILQYFWKYISKPVICIRNSIDSTKDKTLNEVLKCFSNNSIRSIVRKIGSEITQLLLAHAFQAYLSLPSQHGVRSIGDSKENVKDKSCQETCKSLISAFNCLKKMNGDMGILPIRREALFMAATISKKS